MRQRLLFVPNIFRRVFHQAAMLQSVKGLLSNIGRGERAGLLQGPSTVAPGDQHRVRNLPCKGVQLRSQLHDMSLPDEPRDHHEPVGDQSSQAPAAFPDQEAGRNVTSYKMARSHSSSFATRGK